MNRLAPVACSSAIAAATLLLAPTRADAAEPTTADCIRANNSSVGLQNDNKLQAARDQLLLCAAQSCRMDIRKECLRRVDEVTAAIPSIIFQAKDAASGIDLSAVKVTVDGAVVAERLDGSAISVDPGEHTFVFETAGQPPLTKQFVIQKAQKDRRESIALGSAPPGDRDHDGVVDDDDACPGLAGVKTDDAKTNGCPGPLPPLTHPPEEGLGTQRILAIVAGGVGVAGVGLGSVFGLVAMSKKNDAQSACPNVCADQSGANKWSDAKTSAQIADVAFVVGGVALAGGAALWFTAGHASNDTQGLAVGVGPGSVRLKGSF